MGTSGYNDQVRGIGLEQLWELRTHLILRVGHRVISNGTILSKDTQLVETLYGSQHFDVAASSSDKIDYHSRARVVRGDSRRNPVETAEHEHQLVTAGLKLTGGHILRQLWVDLEKQFSCQETSVDGQQTSSP